ncbi:Trafficking protein particle complex subunit 11 [Dillenia turbinata]|uniref:Trafficking protein particle complex subunit 11 n=1 Tax=Dillenia turbinata TaxID=194707 RepID=A0AAN8Z2R4_9MAGN
MEEYPEELRTPPVSLVAVVGCPELHAPISTHLHSEHPPINTLALPDLSSNTIASLLPPSSSSSSRSVDDSSSSSASPPVGGILKRDWLLKHRTRVPSVLAALFPSDRISGDPAQWLQVSTDLEYLKAALRGRNIKLVVVVVHSDSTDGINEDRMVAFRKRAEVESKHLISFVLSDASELKQSLERLGSTFAELANAYYRDEGRRIKARIEKKSFSSIELYIRYCFKVAVYAEFRRDWVEALRYYEDGYHGLREMIGMSTRLPAVQRLVEIKSVAEQISFKISTLLLHGGKVTEAVTWFRRHNACYKKLVGIPEVDFLHWDWMSRQYLVFAELLETSFMAGQSTLPAVLGTAEKPLSEWEFLPAFYYQFAAQYLKEKRFSLERELSMMEAVCLDDNSESVVSYVFVGQYARLVEQGDEFALQLLTDEEYIHHALLEGKRFQDSFEIIALLKKSYESYTNLKIPRMASYCAFQMAKEYFAVGDLSNAKKLLDSIAKLYRQEGWVNLLWETLGYLRECSRKQEILEDFVEYSLEMAALPVSSGGVTKSTCRECGPAGPATMSRREVIQKEVFEFVNGKSDLAPTEDANSPRISKDLPLCIEIDLVSPLRVALLASVAFHEQIVKPDLPTLLTVSLLSQLPQTVEIDELEVQFNQSQCNFIIYSAQRHQSAVASNSLPKSRVEVTRALALSANRWLRLSYDVKSGQSGKLECISVIARIGPHFTICCRTESPASMDELPLWKFEDRVETFPTKDPALTFSGQKTIQVEEPDAMVELSLGASGPALVGESFILPVKVTSIGHAIFCGELKINLVDARGGGLVSPREIEPFSMDNHHVELLGIARPEGEDEPQRGADNIRKIQQSFGLVSVPFMNSGDSWSCNLEIKWHRPKLVVVYISLGYSPHCNESTAKVHVHRSLQIEGKSAITISHHVMLPYRRDPLLLSRIRPVPDSDQLISLPLNEKSILIVTAKNCTEVPLQLLSISVEKDDDECERSCCVQHESEGLIFSPLLVPGEEFKKFFSIIPEVNSSKLRMGMVCLRWRRYLEPKEHSGTFSKGVGVLTKHKLPNATVELSPLIVKLECPPYACIGDPFAFFITIQNQTQLLQEIKYSLADSQSFVLSGSHNDIIFLLPKSEHAICHKLVPLVSGLQQLPRVTVTSVRCAAGFQPSVPASSIFVYPTKPNIEMSWSATEEA